MVETVLSHPTASTSPAANIFTQNHKLGKLYETSLISLPIAVFPVVAYKYFLGCL
jgi:hypothetical protein